VKYFGLILDIVGLSFYNKDFLFLVYFSFNREIFTQEKYNKNIRPSSWSFLA